MLRKWLSTANPNLAEPKTALLLKAEGSKDDSEKTVHISAGKEIDKAVFFCRIEGQKKERTLHHI